MMIPNEVIPEIVAIAIISRKAPITAFGGSLILANFGIIPSIAGGILIIYAQHRAYLKYLKAIELKKQIDEMRAKQEKDLENLANTPGDIFSKRNKEE